MTGLKRDDSLQAQRLRQGFFFDVPVYRLSREQYENEITAYIDRNVFPPEDVQIAEYYRANRERRIAIQDLLFRQYGGAWRYNETIGFIRLHLMGSQIRGEYFSVVRKRIVRTRTKTYEYRTHKLAPEIHIPADASSGDIFCLIEQYLKDCQREVPGRCIDADLLAVIGPYVDWRKLFVDHCRSWAPTEPVESVGRSLRRALSDRNRRPT